MADQKEFKKKYETYKGYFMKEQAEKNAAIKALQNLKQGDFPEVAQVQAQRDQVAERLKKTKAELKAEAKEAKAAAEAEVNAEADALNKKLEQEKADNKTKKAQAIVDSLEKAATQVKIAAPVKSDEDWVADMPDSAVHRQHNELKWAYMQKSAPKK